MKLTAYLAIGGSLILLAACASSDARMAKDNMRADRALAALAQKTDADSLAAAGLLSGKSREQSLVFLSRATAAAPDRPDLLWLQAMRCAQSSPCDSVPLERRLRELDPTNGAGWWAALARAGAAHDAEATEMALLAISHSERVDIYWTTLIAHLSRAVADDQNNVPQRVRSDGHRPPRRRSHTPIPVHLQQLQRRAPTTTGRHRNLPRRGQSTTKRRYLHH